MFGCSRVCSELIGNVTTSPHTASQLVQVETLFWGFFRPLQRLYFKFSKAMTTSTASALFPYVAQFLEECGLKKSLKAFLKEAQPAPKQSAGKLTEMFVAYEQVSGASRCGVLKKPHFCFFARHS